jgi:hypothetical protein
MNHVLVSSFSAFLLLFKICIVVDFEKAILTAL